MAKKETFNSSFGLLVALAGSAVGLGNLWRFPYLVGTNGGAAFIIIYLIFVFFLCLPIMYSEFVLGRRRHAGIKNIRILSVISAICVISFYSVVGGWSIGYLLKALTFSVVSPSSEYLEAVYQQTLGGAWSPIINAFIFIAITFSVLLFGVRKGIERYSKFMMPMLFLIIIAIASYSLTLPGASKGVSFLLKPDFSKVNADMLIAALGQAFFSLSLGCGTILTYASYTKKSENIIKTSSLSALSDTIFAIIAGLAIMPAVFAFGISPSEGPGLAFVTLPHIFSQMAGGQIIAILFFVTLFIAAVTSSISLLEVPVSYLMDKHRLSRKSALILSSSLVLCFAVLCALSFGLLKGVTVFGFSIFDGFDKLSANVLMPITGLAVVLYAGWMMKKKDFIDEITSGHTIKYKSLLLKYVYVSVKYIAPIVILLIMLMGIFYTSIKH